MEDFNSILWFKDETIDPDYFVVFFNGRMINEKEDRIVIIDNLSDLTQKLGKFPQPWCGMIKKHFCVSGTLRSKDKINRPMSFVYITKDKNFRSSFDKDMKVSEHFADEETVNCVNNYRNNNAKRLVILITAPILILISILVVGFSKK